MSHTTKIGYDGSEAGDEEGEIAVLHNGDWSGALQIVVPAAWVTQVRPSVVAITFPFGVIEQIAAEHVRHEREVEMEQVSWYKLLGLKGY